MRRLLSSLRNHLILAVLAIAILAPPALRGQAPFVRGDSIGTGEIDISDAIGVLAYQFLGGAAPAQPFPGCGADPSPSLPVRVYSPA